MIIIIEKHNLEKRILNLLILHKNLSVCNVFYNLYVEKNGERVRNINDIQRKQVCIQGHREVGECLDYPGSGKKL